MEAGSRDAGALPQGEDGLREAWQALLSFGHAPLGNLGIPRTVLGIFPVSLNKQARARYRGQRFQTVYKKPGYVEFCMKNPNYYQKSLRMRMFLEYCRGMKEVEARPDPEYNDKTRPKMERPSKRQRTKEAPVKVQRPEAPKAKAKAKARAFRVVKGRCVCSALATGYWVACLAQCRSLASWIADGISF